MKEDGFRVVRLANTHRTLALTGIRDTQGQLVEQLWGNVFEQYMLNGPINITRFKRSVENVVRQQLAFRSRFTFQNGDDLFGPSLRPYLAIKSAPELESFLGGLYEEKIHRFNQSLSHYARTPFHLQNDPLTRVAISPEGRDRWAVTIVQDHSISDAWTLKLFFNAIAQEYRQYQSNITGNPGSLDDSYFDWYEGLRSSATIGSMAQIKWRAIAEAAGDMKTRPIIPGGQWIPRAYRTLNEHFVYRFTSSEQHRLRQRAAQIGTGQADLLLGSVQLGLLAITQNNAPVSYVYSGRGEPNAWRAMGLFCEELLTLDAPVVDNDSLGSWMERFLHQNNPRLSMGTLSILDFYSVRSQENVVTSFNFLPSRRSVPVTSDASLDPVSGERYKSLEEPECSSRFGIIIRIWEPEPSTLELRMDVDRRMCPEPERAVKAMLYGALEGEITQDSLVRVLANIRLLWGHRDDWAP